MLIILAGIPGFDDADLPRLVGILFGSLLLINHVVSIESMTSAQLVFISPFWLQYFHELERLAFMSLILPPCILKICMMYRIKKFRGLQWLSNLFEL